MVDFDIYKISNRTSRALFEDVLQAFYSKNYRASILLLYNLIINDLYSKLQSMNSTGLLSVYDSMEKAFKEIEENRKNYTKNKKKPENINKNDENFKNEAIYNEIEKLLFRFYFTQDILNDDSIDTLILLKKTRNRCAHPSFASIDGLYIPSRETCSMFITKFYNEILVVDVFFQDNPFSVIMYWLKNKEWDELKSDYERILYKMNDKYLKKMFNSLIDIIFIEKDDKHQKQYFDLLEILLEYISNKKKDIKILKECYLWEKINKSTIFDAESKDIKNSQKLTIMFKLLYYFKQNKGDNFLAYEINQQNKQLYNHIKDQLDNKIEYFVKYYKIFYDNINSAIKEKIKINDDHFIKSFLSDYQDKFEEYELKKETILDSFEYLYSKVDDTTFDYLTANEIDNILIKIINNDELKYRYTFEDFKNICYIMNNNTQIYTREKIFITLLATLNKTVEKFNEENLRSYENLYQVYSKNKKNFSKCLKKIN